MMMGLPRTVQSFEEIVAYVETSVLKRHELAALVVVHIDEPLLVPCTKQETQQRRDSATKRVRPCANKPYQVTDDPALPKDDSYTYETLVALDNCAPLITLRPTRYRAFDAIFHEVFVRICARYERGEFPGCGVVFDGVDERGASRPAGETREPRTLASSRALTCAAALTDCSDGRGAVGEADLKMRVASTRLARMPVDSPTRPTTILLDTVDTDLLPIMLLEELPLDPTEPPDAMKHPADVYICMRERGDYAKRELAHELRSALGDAAELNTDAGWLVVDVAQLRADILSFVHRPSKGDTVPTQRTILRTVVTAWAVAGCDFVDPVGNSGDALTEAAVTAIERRQDLHACLANLQHDDERALEAIPAMREIIYTAALYCAGRGKSPQRLREVSEVTIRRAIWSMLYWANPGNHPTTYELFGFPRPS